MADLYAAVYNPDVLSCLANLSNDEVFTPPELANQVLDMLPEEIWKDPNARFLDPCSKTGVFLREIAKRLIRGQMPDFDRCMAVIDHKRANNEELSAVDLAYLGRLQPVLDHIFRKQVFGIGITQLTALMTRRSLYCSKWANGKYSVVEFDSSEGNVRYRDLQHTWTGAKGKEKCKWCGASKKELDSSRESDETYAYELIHTPRPEVIYDMQFDVIVGNPPYQMNDGGHGKSAVPIYNKFVTQAQRLRPRYLIMITPSRWFAGGRGLSDFRSEMLNSGKIRKLVDFERFQDAFPGVDVAGGVCYFLWDRDYSGPCTIQNASNKDGVVVERPLNEYPFFVRDNRAIEIVRKVRSLHTGKYMDEVVAPSKPFGLRTYYQPKDAGIPCYYIQKLGKQYADPKDVTDQYDLLDKWKLLVPRSPIAGQTDFSKAVKFYYDENTKVAAPGECCTESFIVVYSSKSQKEVISFKTYLYTRIVRFLLLQAVVSQDVTRQKYYFVPNLGTYEGEYSDERLCKMWNITQDEYAYICTRVGEAVKSDA